MSNVENIFANTYLNNYQASLISDEITNTKNNANSTLFDNEELNKAQDLLFDFSENSNIKAKKQN